MGIHMQVNRHIVAAILTLGFPALVFSGTTFSVSVDPAARHEACSGRLVVYLINETSQMARGRDPADGPFFEDPQPMFGVDVSDLKLGNAITVDDAATSFPVKPSQLAPGKYI